MGQMATDSYGYVRSERAVRYDESLFHPTEGGVCHALRHECYRADHYIDSKASGDADNQHLLSVPAIVTSGLVSPTEAHELLRLYVHWLVALICD